VHEEQRGTMGGTAGSGLIIPHNLGVGEKLRFVKASKLTKSKKLRHTDRRDGGRDAGGKGPEKARSTPRH